MAQGDAQSYANEYRGRPPLISDKAYELLNELRGFRHVFRHAYGYELEPEKIKIVLRKALALRKMYKKEIAGFLDVLREPKG